MLFNNIKVENRCGDIKLESKIKEILKSYEVEYCSNNCIYDKDIDIAILDASNNKIILDNIRVYKENNIGSNIILIIDRKNNQHLEEYIGLGVRDFILKPYIDSEIVRVLDNVIKNVTSIKQPIIRAHNIKSDTDDLTQVGNRRIIFEYIDERMKRKDSLTLYFIDLDNFKKLNQIYGFSYGDEVLKEIADDLKNIFKKCLISRIGGDNFLIADDIPLDKNVVEKKFNLIKAALEKMKNSEMLSISMGVIDSDNSGNSTVEEIVARGNISLSKSKESGKNRYTIYDDILEKETMFKIQMERDISVATENEEIVLFYQPKYTVEKELKGYEALFRWNNNKYSKVPVYKIIEVIENSDMILKVGEYVLEKAFRFSNKINDSRKSKLMISVNISPRQIMCDNFLERVITIIRETNVDTSTIIFEITENLFIDNMSESIKKLSELKKLGILISLDDFGTGYSSLSHLVKLPIDELKVDRSFIVGIESNDNYVRIIKGIAEIAHTLELALVAEGIEEQWQLEIMKQMGIDLIQGYLFGKPMAEEDALNLI